MHLIDHLYRLLHRAGQERRFPPLWSHPALRRPARAFAAGLRRGADAPSDTDMAARLARLHGLGAGRAARLRRQVLLRERAGQASPADVFALTDALRWLERSLHHAQRIVHYGAVTAQEAPSRADAALTAAPAATTPVA